MNNTIKRKDEKLTQKDKQQLVINAIEDYCLEGTPKHKGVPLHHENIRSAHGENDQELEGDLDDDDDEEEAQNMQASDHEDESEGSAQNMQEASEHDDGGEADEGYDQYGDEELQNMHTKQLIMRNGMMIMTI
ncbi:hypothetical protein PS2_034945 [Malus domestica]